MAKSLMRGLDLSIIIVSWNVADYLGPCLESIQHQLSDLHTEVILVDNASSDGTVELVSQRFPWVSVIQAEKNIGFPKANNLAINRAAGKYVLLLNPDTVISDGTLKLCFDKVEEDPSIGALGCKIVYPDGSIQLECARNFPSLTAMIWESLYLHTIFPRHQLFGRSLMGGWDHDSDRDVPCILGAFMLVRKQALDQVGGLDEQFFMYYEDIDLCANLWENGWRIRYTAGTQITHNSGKSRSRSVMDLDLLATEIQSTFFREHRGWATAWAYRALLIPHSLVRIVIALILNTLTNVLNMNLRAQSAMNLSLHVHRLRWALGVRTRKPGFS